ncbi:MAG: MBL fold metallo-hydrolase [Thermoleophilia bacterium]|nr:MBL fold metallo-hydrolase [Thermoleophilia bacterium]
MNALTYVGHATVEIEMDGVRLLTDPVLRRRIAHLRRQVPLPHEPFAKEPDAILLSHQHFDHLDLPSLRGFGPECRIISGPGSRPLLEKNGFGNVEELAVGEAAAVGAVTVTAVPADHDGRRRPFTEAGEAVGFLVGGSQQVYFAGDTDLYPDMDLISPMIDTALIPVWGWGHTLGEGHMDPAVAARAIGLINPRIAIPIHWGTFFPMILGRWGRHHLSRPPRRFADQVAESSPAVEVRVLEPGESTPLD